MPFTIACPSCSTRFTAPDTAAGKRVRCPKCQAAVPIPAAEAEDGFEVVDDPAPPAKPAKKKPVVVEDEDDDEEERPRKKRPRAEQDEDEDEDRPRKKRRRDEEDEDEDDDRPRRRGKSGSGVSMTRNVIMGVVLLILASVAGYIFYTKLNQPGDDTPKADPGIAVPGKK